jgi:hypothetical protein
MCRPDSCSGHLKFKKLQRVIITMALLLFKTCQQFASKTEMGIL